MIIGLQQECKNAWKRVSSATGMILLLEVVVKAWCVILIIMEDQFVNPLFGVHLQQLQQLEIIGFQLQILMDNVLKQVLSAITRKKIIMLEVVVEAPFVNIMMDGDIVKLNYHVLHQAKSAGMDQMVG